MGGITKWDNSTSRWEWWANILWDFSIQTEAKLMINQSDVFVQLKAQENSNYRHSDLKRYPYHKKEEIPGENREILESRCCRFQGKP